MAPLCLGAPRFQDCSLEPHRTRSARQEALQKHQCCNTWQMQKGRITEKEGALILSFTTWQKEVVLLLLGLNSNMSSRACAP